MAKDPAFLFYTSDFITGTMFMTNEQVGIYIRLLCAQHQHGGLVDKESFNNMVGDHKLIRNKFIETEDGFYNERMREESLKRSSYCASRKHSRTFNVRKPYVERMEDVNEDVNVIKKRVVKSNIFIPPTLEEVKKYFAEKKTKIDPIAFHAHYETNGWKQGAGRPIKNWKACLVTWEQRRKDIIPTETPHGKPPAEFVAIQCVAMKMSDEDIKAHLIDKGYTEHRAVEAIMRARGKNE